MTPALQAELVTIEPTDLRAGFQATLSSGPMPLQVTLTNTSTGALDFEWDFGDGSISSDFNPSHTYLNAGVYTLVLTISNWLTEVTATTSIHVTPLNLKQGLRGY